MNMRNSVTVIKKKPLEVNISLWFSFSIHNRIKNKKKEVKLNRRHRKNRIFFSNIKRFPDASFLFQNNPFGYFFFFVTCTTTTVAINPLPHFDDDCFFDPLPPTSIFFTPPPPSPPLKRECACRQDLFVLTTTSLRFYPYPPQQLPYVEYARGLLTLIIKFPCRMIITWKKKRERPSKALRPSKELRQQRWIKVTLGRVESYTAETSFLKGFLHFNYTTTTALFSFSVNAANDNRPVRTNYELWKTAWRLEKKQKRNK